MTKYKIGICADENIFIKQIEDMVLDFSKENVFPVDIIKYENGKQLIGDRIHFNLLFLDIEMKELNGIDLKNLLEKSFNNCKIIFVSNYENRMVEAFGKNVIAFINKKNINEIKRYLRRLMNEKNSHNILNLGDNRIDLFDILYIKADGSYSNIISNNKSYVYCIYLADILKRLNDKNIVRCHRSYAVNLRYIKDVVKSNIILLNGEAIPFSRNYKDIVLEQYFTYVREN